MKRTIFVAAMLAAVAGACGGGDGSAADAGPDALEPLCPPASGGDVRLDMVVTGLANPIFVTAPPGDPRLFVVEQGGRIKIVKDGALLPAPFLDIDDRVTSGGERGLLGLAFHPDFPRDPRFFVDYSAQSSPQGSGAHVVAEYRISSDPDVADRDSELRVLEIPDFAGNHNGGMIAFGTDGYLYVAMGDGGGGGDNDDPDHPGGNGQDTTTLLAGILRIDVSAPGSYSIPADNPFADSPDGTDDPRPELWAYGLRNPWRFSFDRQTGDLYIGDVGQDSIEEVDFHAAGSPGGANFGWRQMEASSCFNPPDGCDTSGKVLPISEYAQDSGRCSVTGGYVYRGTCMTDLQGTYLFGDYCTGEVWGFEYDGSPNNTPALLTTLGSTDDLASFGEDATGELYITAHSGTLYRIVADGN